MRSRACNVWLNVEHGWQIEICEAGDLELEVFSNGERVNEQVILLHVR